MCPWDNTRPHSAHCASPPRDLGEGGGGGGGEARTHTHELRTSRRTGYRRIFAFRAGSRRRMTVGERAPDPGPGSQTPRAHMHAWRSSGDGLPALPLRASSGGKVVTVWVGGGGGGDGLALASAVSAQKSSSSSVSFSFPLPPRPLPRPRRPHEPPRTESGILA